MRSRIPALLALSLVLCALPGVRAFASAMPCCSASGTTAPGLACATPESDCCDLVPATPAAPASHANVQLLALAIAPSAVAPPAPPSIDAPHASRTLADRASPARLSVVRLL